jgi:hypothetical protein
MLHTCKSDYVFDPFSSPSYVKSNHTKTQSGFLAQKRTWLTSLMTYVSDPALLVKKGDPPPS